MCLKSISIKLSHQLIIVISQYIIQAPPHCVAITITRAQHVTDMIKFVGAEKKKGRVLVVTMDGYQSIGANSRGVKTI